MGVMQGPKALFILFGLLVGIIAPCNGRPDFCMTLYKEGGVSAVLGSPECAFEYLPPRNHSRSKKCQFATFQGRRDYQEDRILCDLDMKSDLLGNFCQEDLKIALAAVFDGHGGKEASELAVQLFPFYFQFHVIFLGQEEMELFKDKPEMTFPLETEVNPLGIHFGRCLNESQMLKVFEEAIRLTIHDIDSTFSQMASKKQLLGGTTATVAIIVDSQLLVGNVGDSKALLCSEKIPSGDNGDGIAKASIQVAELTTDHHPDRDDEKARIIASGGFVSLSGMPRVNGILAVSRAIGDINLKRYGVIAEPEMTGWLHLNASDSFLVIASDGVFESLSPQEVCSLLQDVHSQSNNEEDNGSSKCLMPSLAECIVNTAFEKGSTDNLSAVVVPLRTL